MGRGWRAWALVAVGLVAACDGGGSDGGGREDATTSDDGGSSRSDGAAPDGGPAPDGGSADAAPADAARPGPDAAIAPVESCQDACDRFAACERLGEVFGDEGACLAACERSARGGPPTAFFECLGVEACNLLHLCRLPAPPPLTCDEVCADATACEATLPFDCASTCAGAAGPVGACGERLYAGRCDVDGFVRCVAGEVFSDCSFRCERATACGVEVPDDCLGACLAEGDAPDPLARLRGEQRNTCVRLAAQDCARVHACLHPEDAPAPPVADRATFCRLWEACPSGRELPCDLGWQRVSPPEGPWGAAECVVARLEADGCPDDLFRLIEDCFAAGPVHAGPGCLALCEARDLCGHADAGRQACVDGCEARLAGGLDAAERQRLAFPCALSASCDGLDACLEAAAPATACADHCTALDACGLAPEACAAACEADFTHDRQAAWRACVAAAEGDCGAAAACAPTAPPLCEAQCARFEACNMVAPGPDCLLACDDDHFADADIAERRFACVLTAQTCFAGRGDVHTVDGCRLNPLVGGSECLAWCRAVSDACVPGGARGYEDCLVECGAGFVGGEAVGFAATRDCLAANVVTGECAPLVACVAEPPAPDCASWCGGLVACGLEDDGCAARCAADTLAVTRALQQAGCVRAAGDDCAAVEACVVTVAAPAAPVDPQAFCAAYEGCGLDEALRQPCAAALRFIEAQGPGAARCVFDEMRAACPRDPFLVLQRCGGGSPAVDEAGACAALCEARAVCDALDGQTGARCLADCARVFVSDDEAAARLRPLLACADARACGDLAACLARSGPGGVCEGHCAAVAACGLEAEPAACAARCVEAFAHERHVTWRSCVAGAGDDCEAVAACAPPAALPCDAYCERLGECQLFEGNPAACATTCDDAHFAAPAGVAERLVCVLAAPACHGDGHTVEACVLLEPPPPHPGSACVAWCRAVTECDPDAGRDLAACVTACADGFVGEEAAAFDAARACLGEQGSDAACDGLRACVPGAPAED
jgi:hypothetical protein